MVYVEIVRIINLMTFYVKKYLSVTRFFLLFLLLVCSTQAIESSSSQNTSSGIADYLDLSQHGVSEEYAEYLQIGSQQGIAEARAQGIKVNTGLDDSGEMMEGILYVYGIKARQEDLYKRILILVVLIFGILLVKRTIR